MPALITIYLVFLVIFGFLAYVALWPQNNDDEAHISRAEVSIGVGAVAVFWPVVVIFLIISWIFPQAFGNEKND